MYAPADGLEPGLVSPSSLAARIASGDREAEAEFVARYRAGVHALVRRHCRPLEPAVDDLVQDVMLAVLQRLREGALRDEALLPAYVRSTVVLTVQAEYRKRSRRGEHVSDEHLETTSLDVPVSGAGEEPPLRLQREQLARRMRAVLADLDVARDRQILHRFYLQEHDRDDICRDLGIDQSHFRRVLFRARERLAELLRRNGLQEER